MKIKNSDLRRVSMALFSLGDHQGNMKDRWEITKYTKHFNDALELLENQIQILVEKKGKRKDGQKTLSVNDKDYIELMDLDIEIGVAPLTFSDLERYCPSTQEMMNLIPVVEEE